MGEVRSLFDICFGACVIFQLDINALPDELREKFELYNFFNRKYIIYCGGMKMDYMPEKSVLCLFTQKRYKIYRIKLYSEDYCVHIYDHKENINRTVIYNLKGNVVRHLEGNEKLILPFR